MTERLIFKEYLEITLPALLIKHFRGSYSRKKIKYSECRYIQYITYIFIKLQVNISPFLRTVFQNLVHLFSDKTPGGNSVASYGSDVLYGAFSCELKRGYLKHSLSRQVFCAIDGCKHLNC